MIPGTFLGEMLQWVYFIFALADNLYSYFISAMIISTATSFGIVLGMTTWLKLRDVPNISNAFAKEGFDLPYL
jgi:hypothetical protein